MTDELGELEIRAINAALEAVDYLDLSYARLERERAAAIGPWPHQAALYALTVEEIGKEAAENLIQLHWVPDWATPEPAPDLDPTRWLLVGDAKEWPRVIQRIPTVRWGWPWFSPEGLREAATCLELMLRAEVLEPHRHDVGGPVLWLADWVWDSLRAVTEHIHEAVVDEATGNTVWRHTGQHLMQRVRVVPKPDLKAAYAHARELIVFADGIDEGGFPHFARRARLVARELLEALDALEGERSARRALQARCEQQQAILARHAYEATQ